MACATRGSVHRSVPNPCVRAPCRSAQSTWRSCSAFSLGIRPARPAPFSAAMPPPFHCRYHRVTLCRLTCSARAIPASAPRPFAFPNSRAACARRCFSPSKSRLCPIPAVPIQRNLAQLIDLSTYYARLSRRFIPKADGRQRPLGVPALEDKIVQRAVGEVLNAIYEADFLAFSYGFRPGRSPHHALDALATGIHQRRVNWVLDADIRSFFDTLDHGWLVKFLEHRIADRRVVRLIQKWLKAGVLEDGKRTRTELGTVQGGSISPLLANVYLHYAFDLWAQRWRKKQARGDVVVVRYADDFVVGFEHREEAERFLEDLRERFARFGLELHPDKTRLIPFGRKAQQDWHDGRGPKPDIFHFLGFTHSSGRTRKGKFIVLRQTMRKRVQAKLKELKMELRRRMHQTIPEQGAYLRSVVTGHVRYFGVPLNGWAIVAFRQSVGRLWRRTLRRRSQKHRLTTQRFHRYMDRWLPPARVCHPYPWARFGVITQGRSPVR